MAAEKIPTVLVVEDDAGIAELEKQSLEAVGHTVLLAATAEEAMGHVRRGGVDLILLDYHLPGNVDGLDFHAQVRAAGYDLPVILVTGFSDEATVITALRAGVRDFITKSVEYLDYLPEAANRVLRQVRTERQLAESEARLAAVIDSAKDAILIADASQRIALFNPAAERMFRCPAAHAVGRPVARLIPREHVPAPDGGKGAPGRPDEETLSHVARWGDRGVRGDGEEFPLEASVSKFEVAGRKFYTMVVRDVTERKRAECQIQEQAALLDKAADAIIVLGLDGRTRYWNHGAERLYGWTAAEAVGSSVAALHGDGLAAGRGEAERAVLEKGEWAGELSNVTRAGRDVTVESRWTLVRDDLGEPRAKLIIDTDVTEKKKLQAQLAQAQRMEGIGMLAGGVAHDFNNLLTVIIGYSEMLLSENQPESQRRELVHEIKKAGERAATLTRQLLAFSRKQVLQPVTLDLNALISELEKMLRRMIGEDIDLATALAPDLGRVKADPGQIEQVVMNLVVNARDAMPTGGRITVETRNVELDESYAEHNQGVRPGPHVMLAVCDTGCGMDAATLARVFEPFFTTKEVGKGTGLGLATVYGVVKQSGGRVAVYSEQGLGTTFKIYLPRTEDAVRQGVSLTVPAAAPQGDETVLLAEDDEAIRRIASIVLESSGYTVLAAQDGDEALQIGRAHPGPIHLLMTDVVMPKMCGRQLAEALAPVHPQMNVLYLSGYTDDAVVRHGVLEAGSAFLQKPFTPGVLARKVRECLDGQGAGPAATSGGGAP